jgi:hypothetical protein
MSLTYQQQQEVRRLIDEKHSTNTVFDEVKKMLDQVYFVSRINEETAKAAPPICQKWADNNLSRLTETTAERFMRGTLIHFLHNEIANNREIANFVSSHLKSVEETVVRTTEAKIHDIVNASPGLNPVIQQHLAFLSKKNENQLNEQSNDIKKNANLLRSAVEQNNMLQKNMDSWRQTTKKDMDSWRQTTKKDIDSLKRTNFALTGISVVSLIGVVGLGIQFISKM